MATSPSFLPVASLSQLLAVADTDSFVIQEGAANGDVKLLSVRTFLNTFVQKYIDDSTIDPSTITLYESLGWEYVE